MGVFDQELDALVKAGAVEALIPRDFALTQIQETVDGIFKEGTFGLEPLTEAQYQRTVQALAMLISAAQTWEIGGIDEKLAPLIESPSDDPQQALINSKKALDDAIAAELQEPVTAEEVARVKGFYHNVRSISKLPDLYVATY